MTLFRHHIYTLRLRPDAPFPSEAFDARQLIKDWRYEQRCRLVCRYGSTVRSVVSDCDDDLLILGE